MTESELKLADHIFVIQCSTHAFEKHRFVSMQTKALADCVKALEYIDTHGDDTGQNNPKEAREYVQFAMVKTLFLPARSE